MRHFLGLETSGRDLRVSVCGLGLGLKSLGFVNFPPGFHISFTYFIL